jgi:hypothetical protein
MSPYQDYNSSSGRTDQKSNAQAIFEAYALKKVLWDTGIMASIMGMIIVLAGLVCARPAGRARIETCCWQSNR